MSCEKNSKLRKLVQKELNKLDLKFGLQNDSSSSGIGASDSSSSSNSDSAKNKKKRKRLITRMSLKV